MKKTEKACSRFQVLWSTTFLIKIWDLEKYLTKAESEAFQLYIYLVKKVKQVLFFRDSCTWPSKDRSREKNVREKKLEEKEVEKMEKPEMVFMTETEKNTGWVGRKLRNQWFRACTRWYWVNWGLFWCSIIIFSRFYCL